MEARCRYVYDDVTYVYDDVTYVFRRVRVWRRGAGGTDPFTAYVRVMVRVMM